MGEFFYMGGYGTYIWSAYLIVVVVFLVVLLQTLKVMRQREGQLEALRRDLRVDYDEGIK